MEKQRVGKLEEKRKDASAVNQEETKKRESYSDHAESDIHTQYVCISVTVCSRLLIPAPFQLIGLIFFQSQITVVLPDQ